MIDSNYWDKIYSTKSETEVSWFQEVPTKSLELISELHLPLDAHIIDIGGGNSRLVDNLLKVGFFNISILDISSVALEKAQERLAEEATKVQFNTSDITSFKPTTKFDVWHDRATFHFLTQVEQVEKYLSIAYHALNPGGHLFISTFSKKGPEKCSGLPITQYSEEDLKSLFGKYFQISTCFEHVHKTPWDSEQWFVTCCFKKI